MYKHQVIGVRQERSWRSRESEHIVGICTLEALDLDDRFHNFYPTEDWLADDGQVKVGSKIGNLEPSELKLRCRHWALEEVVEALKQSTPRHEFYTWDEQGKKVRVFSYLGKTDLYTLNAAGKKVRVYCDRFGHGLHVRHPTRGRLPFKPTAEMPLFVRDPRTKKSREVTILGGILYTEAEKGDHPLEEVDRRGGDVRWIKTRGDRKRPGNLHWLSSTPVPCPRANCPIIPAVEQAVFRADGPDG